MAEREGPLTIAELDALPDAEAGALLGECCGSRRWVRQMLARRPFRSSDALLSAADDVWWALAPDDWREAFAHHPRIGERQAAIPQDARSTAWSGEEQRGVSNADQSLHAALAQGNREYERKFGHIYLVNATGKGAGELLTILDSRLAHDATTELRVAAAEQAQITALRLVRLTGVEDVSRRDR